MVDTDAVLVDFLLAQSGLTDVVDTRIWASNDPAPNYQPNTGPAIVFVGRGGNGFDYDDATISVAYQFRSFGVDEATARQADRALTNSLHNAKSSFIKHAELERPGNLLLDPDTGWPFVLSSYTVLFANS